MLSVVEYKKIRKEAETERQQFFYIWEMIGRYVNQRKTGFNSESPRGDFLSAEIFDTTAPDSCQKASAAIAGMLWQGGESVNLKSPLGLKENEATKKYYEAISKVIALSFNDSEANFNELYLSYMYDQLSFGTSGLGAYRGDEGEPFITFKGYGVDSCALIEDYRGKVKMIFHERMRTVEQIVEEFGVENVSSNLREAYNDGDKTKKEKIVQVVHKNLRRVPGKKGNKNMPFTSMHYEEKSAKIIRSSGYEESPIEFHRYFKRDNETYARSPSTQALPDILEINHNKEMRIVAIEKKLDPPLGIVDDSVAGGGFIDTSAGSVTVVNMKGRAGSTQNPIFPLYSVGDIREADKSIEELKDNIKGHYNMDRLLDFSTSVQQTLGEAQMREKIRAQGLSSILGGQIKFLNRVIERVVSIHFREGKLGFFSDSEEVRAAQELGLEDVLIIPDEIAKLILNGEDFYEIEHITSAMQLVKAKEADGVIQLWDFAERTKDPQIKLILDPVASMKVMQEASGAPAKIMRSKEEYNKILEQMAQAAQQQQEMQAAQEAANVAKTATEAAGNVGENIEGTI